ncbi:hypothetical protein BKA61DRAFT_150803 [Leptodontidium sp. MPI-SDFR-AT-0119]|nr:hypothetical protein BKA61DRAFT_150803 [Leptodontidium sp. MPI-SDFR-AT-0119]
MFFHSALFTCHCFLSSRLPPISSFMKRLVSHRWKRCLRRVFELKRRRLGGNRISAFIPPLCALPLDYLPMPCHAMPCPLFSLRSATSRTSTTADASSSHFPCCHFPCFHSYFSLGPSSDTRSVVLCTWLHITTSAALPHFTSLTTTVRLIMDTPSCN